MYPKGRSHNDSRDAALTLHLSQLSPITLGLQMHCPVKGSHLSVPRRLQAHARTHQRSALTLKERATGSVL